MKNILKITWVISICLIGACEDHDKASAEFYILDTGISSNQMSNGFSFKDMTILSYPFSDNNMPDFLLSVHTNETGDILGPMLSHPELENRFVFIKKFADLNSAQYAFDTLSTISSSPLQPFAFDLTPNEIWQVRTNTGESGKLLIMETKTEKINNTPFAEIKLKAKIINP